MGKAKAAVTKVELETKEPGKPELKKHRPGIRCSVERHSSNLGQFVVWVGKRYALVDAVKIHDTVFYLESNGR